MLRTLLLVLTLVAFILIPSYAKSMADPVVWGLLPKAQDNPQTINDAIAAAIAAHEADPEAHLGEGESLQTHRQNETLDHPAGSVLADKNTDREFTYQTQFDSELGWALGGWYNFSPLSTFLEVASGDTELSYMVLLSDILAFYDPFAVEWLWQETARAFITDPANYAMMGIGYAGYSPSTVYKGSGAYFFIDDEALHARTKTTAETNDVEITGVDLTDLNAYRIHCVPSEGNVYFYVNGVLKATLPIPSGSDTFGFGFHHWLEGNGSSYDDVVQFGTMSFALSL